MAARSPSTFTCKTTMAITGSIFAGYVLVHMIGNLKAYLGPHAFNTYAAWLREVGYPLVPHQGVLWTLRVVLAVSLVLHVGCGLLLWARGRAARGRFRRRRLSWRAAGALTMVPTGLILLAFVTIHVLDLTTGHLGAAGFRHADAEGSHAYANLVASFQRPAYAVAYLTAMLTLAVHLAQGLWSVLHDLGGTAPRLRRLFVALAAAVVLAITLVNSSLPIAVWAGWLS